MKENLLCAFCAKSFRPREILRFFAERKLKENSMACAQPARSLVGQALPDNSYENHSTNTVIASRQSFNGQPSLRGKATAAEAIQKPMSLEEENQKTSSKPTFPGLPRSIRSFWWSLAMTGVQSTQKCAFSLVEMLMALLVASLLLAALAPVMTKRMDEAKINISGVGAAQYDKDSLISIYTGSPDEDKIFNVPSDVNMIKATLIGGGGAGGNSFYGKDEITTSKSWTVPEGVTKLRVFMLGGGGGGASGGVGVGTAYGDMPAIGDGTWEKKVAGEYELAANITPPSSYKTPALDANCLASGTTKWTIVSDGTTVSPNTTLSKISSASNITISKVTACGGGGGGGGGGLNNEHGGGGGGGGSGGYIANLSIDKHSSNFYVKIGGGGGYGSYSSSIGGTGEYGSGGGGGGYSKNGGNGGMAGTNGGTGGGGSYVSTTESAESGSSGRGSMLAAGGNGGLSPCEGYGGYGGGGSIWGGGGGGGGKACSHGAMAGGGGGGPTTITTTAGISDADSIIFQVGGGGGGGGAKFGSSSAGGGGGGGGGYGGGGGGGGATQTKTSTEGTGGNGGTYKSTIIGLSSGISGNNGGIGSDSSGGGGGGGGGGNSGSSGASMSGGNSGSVSNIFGTNNCNGGNGGARSNNGESGKPGAIKLWYSIPIAKNALKCTYNMPANGSGGGGAGQLVVGEINVTPGETLYFEIGSGGASQVSAGKNGNNGMSTRIRRGSASGTVIAEALGGFAGQYSSAESTESQGGGYRTNVAIGEGNTLTDNWTGVSYNLTSGTGENGKLANALLNKGYGGNGGISQNIKGEDLQGGQGGNSVKNGASPDIKSYGAGGGGGSGAQTAGDTFGIGAAGASGYIYFEYGGSNGGGGTAGEMITKIITNIKGGTELKINIGEGGDNSTGDGNGKATSIEYQTSSTKTLSARGGIRGNDGLIKDTHAAEQPLPDNFANKNEATAKGGAGEALHGGIGGYIEHLYENADGTWATYIKAKDGTIGGPVLGGCGGNLTALTGAILCNGTDSAPNGKDGVFGGGGGGGAVINEVGGLGGRGGKGMVILEYKAVGL